MRNSRSPVTVLLIVANVVMFIAEYTKVGSSLLGGNFDWNRIIDLGVLVPVAVTQNGEWWRVIASGFLHGSGLHIGVNMFSLWILGRFIETIAGSLRMAAIYAISLVGSGVACVYMMAPNAGSIGASGAIFGLFGALFAIGFKLGPPGMQLVRANIGILIINLIFTFTVPGISIWAHVGGLVVGFIVGYAIYFPPRPVHADVIDANSGQYLASEYESPPTTNA